MSKFDALGASWWDAESTKGAGPLHAMNPCRTAFIAAQATEWLGADAPSAQRLSGLRALDVGCGGGLLSESLSRLGAAVTAIDPAPNSIAAAKRHASSDEATSGIRYMNTDVETVAEKKPGFDLVCSLEVIEHAAAPSAFVQNVAACARPGGLVVLSTINRTPKAYAMTILGAEYVLGLLPPGTHDYGSYVTPEELAGMVEAAGCEVLATKGLVLRNPITGAWALDDGDTDVNYIMAARRREES